MKEENKIIKGLWIGPELSKLEQLCIRSFLACGHSFHLYTYDHIKGIPSGVEIKNAQSIVPKDMIFPGENSEGFYKGLDAFSDYFRHTLLNKLGGWWVDLDIICIKPFDFPEKYVFSQENDRWNKTHPTSGVIKVPPGSPIMAYCEQKCAQYTDKTKIRYLDIGPKLIQNALIRFRKYDCVKKSKVFMPIGWWEIEKLIEPGRFRQLYEDNNIYAIHFWNERWRHMAFNKNAQYHPESIFEQLKKIYSN